MEDNPRSNNSLANNQPNVQPNRNNANDAQGHQPVAGIAFAIVGGNNANAQEEEVNNDLEQVAAEVVVPAIHNHGEK